jgi:hypothetical protein
MKTIPSFLFASSLWLFALSSYASPVPYSGKVAINGENFNGTAKFVFELRDADGTVHWRNGADANASIEVHVENGRYVVLLGGQGMAPAAPRLFLDEPELYLKVRVDLSDGNGMRHLAPDQRITSTPHALSAEVARSLLPGVVDTSMLNDKFRKYAEATFRPKLIEPLEDRTVTEAYPIELKAPVEGEFLTYKWYKDGNLLWNQTGPKLSIPHASPVVHNGNYRVVATNEWGSVESNATVNVDWNPGVMAAGVSTSYFVAGDGIVRAMGWALGADVNNKFPVILSDEPVVNIDSVRKLFLRNDGSLWRGTVNDGTYGFEKLLEDVANISSGGCSIGGVLIAKKDGSLWAMGHNSWGAYGNGTRSASMDVPIKVMQSAPGLGYSDGFFGSMAHGATHSLFVSYKQPDEGLLFGMGRDANWQLGMGTIGDSHYLVPTRPYGGVDDVLAVAAGERHSLVLKRDGSLYVSGDNNKGQIGRGVVPFAFLFTKIVDEGVTSITAAGGHSLFIKSDGSLWAMGNNFSGQLGTGDRNNSTTPVKVVDSDVVAVETGGGYTLFRKSDGSFWGMGANHDGQLGIGKDARSYSDLDGDNNIDARETSPVKIWPRTLEWTEQKLTPWDGAQGGLFGDAVGISGNTILVGSPSSTVNGLGNAGALYLYRANANGVFQQAAKVLSPSPAQNESLGGEVSISGNYFSASGGVYGHLVSAKLFHVATDLSVNAVGASGLFSSPSSLVDNQSLIWGGYETSGGAVISYDINPDGSLSEKSRISGSPGESTRIMAIDIARMGKHVFMVDLYRGVLAYDLDTQKRFSDTLEGNVGDSFQYGWGIAANDDLMAVTNWSDLNNSVIEIYQMSPSNALEKVASVTPDASLPGDHFGGSLAMTDKWLVAGAPSTTVEGKELAGAVYVFKIEESGQFTQVAKLTASDPKENASLGFSVSVSGDVVVVGGSGNPVGELGDVSAFDEVYVFRLQPDG